jgi:AraC family transcriptional regulator of adaptative response/methylated-DNA-[protein]-cysteine methyltransferase
MAANQEQKIINLTRFDTPLGKMTACAGKEGVCLLEFSDRRMLANELKWLHKHFKTEFTEESNPTLIQLQNELEEYFSGKRKDFSVPLFAPGSEFQQKVWKELQTIPYGKTRSYHQQSVALGNPFAIRAVAGANGMNRISILIPCHRVIGSDGKLTGYGGGLWRKKWLLDLERANSEESVALELFPQPFSNASF